MAALGWTTDARVLLSLGLAYRILGRHDRLAVANADRFLTVIGTTTLLHHAIKKLVAQQRPDRVVVKGDRRGVPKTGVASQAFPSGHAMHAGALAVMLSASGEQAPLIWMAGGLVASSRVFLLAHWPSGVAAGFAMGACVANAFRESRLQRGRCGPSPG